MPTEKPFRPEAIFVPLVEIDESIKDSCYPLEQGCREGYLQVNQLNKTHMCCEKNALISGMNNDKLVLIPHEIEDVLNN